MRKLMKYLLAIGFFSLCVFPNFGQEIESVILRKLRQEADGVVETVWNKDKKAPSFIRAIIPVQPAEIGLVSSAQSSTFAFLKSYKNLFQIDSVENQLEYTRTIVDSLGMQHAKFRQVYEGIEVFGGSMNFHLSNDNQSMLAVNNGFVPEIRLTDMSPEIDGTRAQEIALQALPNSQITSESALYIFAGLTSDPKAGKKAKLSWMVELRNDSIPARYLFIIDANKGKILDTLNRLYIGRERLTYDAGNTSTIPGTLARDESSGPSGDADIDAAHDFAGDTYDYYFNTHGRDSYDGAGATISSTANYGSGYQNAFWNGSQMVYGDGYAVNDVVAHELTHAVTEYTANLIYRWQSGALNESFSDIFGAMVDRSDWLIGEDLPIGAIRSLSDPTSFGDPDHTSNWVEGCGDNEGVHTNSGIHNKAFFNVATAIGRDKAERIFYRTLTQYLNQSSGMEDARAGSIQSAVDLYGNGSAEHNAVVSGFNAVGLDGIWNPPTNDCGIGSDNCFVSNLFADTNAFPDNHVASQTSSTLYRVRDELLASSSAGNYYYSLYEDFTGRMAYLIALDVSLLK